MNLTAGIVLYAIFWFMSLFMILPLFVKSQGETGEVVPGTSAGAPDAPLMKKKLIWTTIVATTVWIIAFAIIKSEIISINDIAALTGQDMSGVKGL